jgi:hypothetical protein
VANEPAREVGQLTELDSVPFEDFEVA